MASASKIELRRNFITSARKQTYDIHEPIIDLSATDGALNPAGHGNARKFSQDAPGQSTVGFHSLDDYEKADRTGTGYNGGAEYAIVRSSSAARVCKEFNERHGGEGAVILPSGLSAINMVLYTYLRPDSAILVPDNCYAPTLRALDFMKERSHPNLTVHRYAGGISGPEMATLLQELDKQGIKPTMLYMESPGSITYEMADVRRISESAQHILKVIDSSWGGVLDRPLDDGADIVIKATTKYEAGFNDTPSGIVVAKSLIDYEELAYSSRVFGSGAVAPETCNRLFHRLADAEDRMGRSNDAALYLVKWLKKQGYVDEVLAPYDKSSPFYNRFREYYTFGNGLLTVKFKPEIPTETIRTLTNALNLIPIGESWGGEVTLGHLYNDNLLRLSIGHEHPDDIREDLQQAALTAGLG